jgi:hypothetical protein
VEQYIQELSKIIDLTIEPADSKISISARLSAFHVRVINIFLDKIQNIEDVRVVDTVVIKLRKNTSEGNIAAAEILMQNQPGNDVIRVSQPQ